jgi:5'-AMP-activated protein kinase catalytic alpha subunit
MEYCEKGELYDLIFDVICLEEDQAAYYYYQLINGLENIHRHGMVHRDLKLENLLIDNKNILKIIDFGLCNYYNKNNLLSTPCGSSCYASPEMISGKKYDGIMVDIWSTGIILYIMLCGFLPFDGENTDKMYDKILKCQVKFPDNLGDDSIDLIKKILVNKPEKRITIKEIKKHNFYLKGKEIFNKIHPNLVGELEKKYEKINIDLYKLIKNNTNRISLKKPNNAKIFNLKEKNIIPNKQLFNIKKYQTDRNDKTRYKKKYNIYSMDQKEIIKNLNQKSSHNNYEINKSLNKVSNDKSYKKNKGKRRTIARNIIYNLLTQNNNNKITNIIIPKYKNTHNILKETKNAEKLSKYTFNDNENIITVFLVLERQDFF